MYKIIYLRELDVRYYVDRSRVVYFKTAFVSVYEAFVDLICTYMIATIFRAPQHLLHRDRLLLICHGLGF